MTHGSCRWDFQCAVPWSSPEADATPAAGSVLSGLMWFDVVVSRNRRG
jgi:hypothetical protein